MIYVLEHGTVGQTSLTYIYIKTNVKNWLNRKPTRRSNSESSVHKILFKYGTGFH
jgi:hypothetical protein